MTQTNIYVILYLMTFKEFITRLNAEKDWKIPLPELPPKNPRRQFSNERLESMIYADYKLLPVEGEDKLYPHLVHSVYMGGISGGSCYDDGDAEHHYDSANTTPEDFRIEKFYEILELVAPEINYLTVSRFEAHIIKSESFSRNEYYGNSSDYVIFTINLLELFNRIKETKYFLWS